MSFDRPVLRVEDEDTGMPCSFDGESFDRAIIPLCESPATKALVDTSDDDFHWAHLCAEHAEIVIRHEAQR